MEEWIECKLGDILNFRRGHDLPHSEMTGGAIPVAGSNGIIGYHNIASPISPCITIGRSGNVGTPYMYEKAWAHNTTLYIDEFKGNDPLYIYYLLKTLPLSSFGGGSAVPTLNRNHIHPLIVKHCKNVSKQKEIASVLRTFDDKIELNNRINHNLEQQAQALYKSWFVDFEPFRDGKFVDSERGLIPEGFHIGTINEIIDIQSGFAFKSDLFNEHGDYLLMTIKAVQDGNLDTTNADRISSIPNKMPKYCFLNKGDILLSLTGNVGRVCIVDQEKLLLNQRVAKLHPRYETNRAFVYSLFRREEMKDQMIQLARGTAQLNLSPVETGFMMTIVPDNQSLKRFGIICNPIFQKLLRIRIENIKLQSMRDCILPKLMSGELKINNLTC